MIVKVFIKFLLRGLIVPKDHVKMLNEPRVSFLEHVVTDMRHEHGGQGCTDLVLIPLQTILLQTNGEGEVGVLAVLGVHNAHEAAHRLTLGHGERLVGVVRLGPAEDVQVRREPATARNIARNPPSLLLGGILNFLDIRIFIDVEKVLKQSREHIHGVCVADW